MPAKNPRPRLPAKPARKAAVPARRMTAPAPAKAAVESRAAQPVKQAKDDKPPKVKLVRDSFTIPKNEYAAIDELKKRAARAGLPSKKSELLRAGLMALAGMGDASFQAAMSGVPRLKTGRPTKS